MQLKRAKLMRRHREIRGGRFLEILNLILPIFGVLLTGMVFAHLKILPEHTADILVPHSPDGVVI